MAKAKSVPKVTDKATPKKQTKYQTGKTAPPLKPKASGKEGC